MTLARVECMMLTVTEASLMKWQDSCLRTEPHPVMREGDCPDHSSAALTAGDKTKNHETHGIVIIRSAGTMDRRSFVLVCLQDPV
jgi:hypothetical protein